jgi:hypothetical protein
MEILLINHHPISVKDTFTSGSFISFFFPFPIGHIQGYYRQNKMLDEYDVIKNLTVLLHFVESSQKLTTICY